MGRGRKEALERTLKIRAQFAKTDSWQTPQWVQVSAKDKQGKRGPGMGARRQGILEETVGNGPASFVHSTDVVNHLLCGSSKHKSPCLLGAESEDIMCESGSGPWGNLDGASPW